jgi:hypothetical protein
MRRRGWFKGTVAVAAWEAYRENMTVTVEIPDSVAASVLPEGVDPARKLLEDAMAQAYREGLIGTSILRATLGLSWHEKEAFLLRYGIYNDIAVAEVFAEADLLKELREKHRAEMASA